MSGRNPDARKIYEGEVIEPGRERQDLERLDRYPVDQPPRRWLSSFMYKITWGMFGRAARVQREAVHELAKLHQTVADHDLSLVERKRAHNALQNADDYIAIDDAHREDKLGQVVTDLEINEMNRIEELTIARERHAEFLKNRGAQVIVESEPPKAQYAEPLPKAQQERNADAVHAMKKKLDALVSEKVKAFGDLNNMSDEARNELINKRNEYLSILDSMGIDGRQELNLTFD